MVVPTNDSPPLSSDNNPLSALWKRFTGKAPRGHSPPMPCSEPGLSRDSSVSSGLARRVSRKVVPGLPRTKTFKRQLSENREKLEAFLPSPAERRGVSVDRRLQPQRSASHSSQLLPRASAPDYFGDAELSTGKLAVLSQTASAPQSPVIGKHFLSLNNIDAPTFLRVEGHADEQGPHHPEAISAADAQSVDTCQYDAMVREELEHKWILNLSMHFRDKSRREKFFVTYREKDSIWRRVTISLDYRSAPSDSLERDLLNTKFQRDKSSKIYEAIRESLQDIQFYDTVTNLKLQTADGRLHVHVVEDVNEIINFPAVDTVQHMNCRRVRESDLEFDSHMSGFVYKVRVNGYTLIKKEIPGPDTIDEFLYEVNALHSLRFSRSIIDFYGVVVDDNDEVVKGLLISYAEKGALVDMIYDSQEQGEQALPWAVREKWARQIVQGLSDIHETGFVQGDFTLSNIVIDDYGNAKIIDINRRGCPVGWEPPEATLLIESNQRISMYIGVKSDLYQLGMVLWALATLEDEPEAHRRPLRLKSELDVPLWYREVVEKCLHENPRVRLQATALLEKFPQTPYDDMYGEPEFPSDPLHDSAPFQNFVPDENYDMPEIRTVEPRSSWASASNSQATSPSLSDEICYQRRGRSPTRTLPPVHDLYPPPYFGGNATWAKPLDIAAMDGGRDTDDAMVGTPTDLQIPTDFANMEDELDQMAASFRVGPLVEDGQARAPGNHSLAFSEPPVTSDGQNEDFSSINEDGPKVLTPTCDLTPCGSSDGTPVAGEPQAYKSTISERPLKDAEATGKTVKDDNADIVAHPVNDRAGAAPAPYLEDQAKFTMSMESRGIETPVIDHTDDRTDDETEDISTRPTEATGTFSDIVPRKDLQPTETPEHGAVDLSGNSIRK
ncbi:hypothetical protein F5Y14DRAFT_37214 [Nemania sp. NC0429]|nr:hypothetical protein F5Y14DRAFT_37214 [Nemania sp. NC0429]